MKRTAQGPATPLPPTEGRWQPVVRGRGTPRARVVGYTEGFPAANPDGGTMYVTIPGASRWVEVAK